MHTSCIHITAVLSVFKETSDVTEMIMPSVNTQEDQTVGSDHNEITCNDK